MRKPLVLIGCEYSGVVREAFKHFGANAWSCDLEDTEIPGQHIITDIRNLLHIEWDLLIAFPPCTHLTRASSRLWNSRTKEQNEAIQLVRDIWNSSAKRIAIENPPGKLSTAWKVPSQIIQPFYYNHPVTKETCLWLKRIPRLNASQIIEPSSSFVLQFNNKRTRAKLRSKTFENIAYEMARQWMPYIQ